MVARRVRISCKLTKERVPGCMASLGGLVLEQEMPPRRPRLQYRLDSRCRDGQEMDTTLLENDNVPAL